MKKYVLFFLVGLLSSFATAGEKDIKFIYSGFEFTVPSGARVFGAQGGRDNFTFFRFSDQKGKDYLSFTDITSESPDYGCSVQEFYAHIAGVSETSTCSKPEIESFKKVFVGDSEVGEWTGKDMTAYYFYGADRSHLLVFAKDRIIKIDTDHLTKPKLKKIIGYYF
ncbi:MAG: hypothetical protein CML06_00735 [Pseudomonadales bacterium]|nr:hypothetical protein [Pseudomonadales bacterium]